MSMKKRMRCLVIVFVVVVLLAAVAVFYFVRRNSGGGDPVAYSTEAVNWDGELSDEDVNPGYIALPGYDTIPLAAGSDKAEIALANPDGNTCWFQFQLVLQDTEEVLYTSDLVAPGKAILNQTLSKSFDEGDYPLIVRINTFSEDGKTSYNGSDIVASLHVFKA